MGNGAALKRQCSRPSSTLQTKTAGIGTGDSSCVHPRYGGMRDFVATGVFHQRLAALPPRSRFFSLVRRELEFPPELHTVGLGSGVALTCGGFGPLPPSAGPQPL